MQFGEQIETKWLATEQVVEYPRFAVQLAFALFGIHHLITYNIFDGVAEVIGAGLLRLGMNNLDPKGFEPLLVLSSPIS